jgi:protein-S-isoprenylcysteine O-methyltransferase Ste14
MLDLLAIMTLIFWPPVVYLIYLNRGFLLKTRTELPFLFNILGFLFLLSGTLLHIWTAKLLGLWGIIGVPEISSGGKENLVDKGPFSFVRHPTYLAHTLMFSGVLLITGIVSVGIVTILDFILVNTVIIPLEEKELSERFGNNYREYMHRVPSRFFPFI